MNSGLMRTFWSANVRQLRIYVEHKNSSAEIETFWSLSILIIPNSISHWLIWISHKNSYDLRRQKKYYRFDDHIRLCIVWSKTAQKVPIFRHLTSQWQRFSLRITKIFFGVYLLSSFSYRSKFFFFFLFLSHCPLFRVS